jgi:hypothetical protein
MARTNYDLGPEVEALLADFCAANDDTPKVRVIRRALKFYIKNRMENDSELAKRVNEARKTRLLLGREKIAIISNAERGR